MPDSGMLELVLALPEHLLAGFVAAGRPMAAARYDNLVVLGMGGSAISGSLLSGLVADSARVPVLSCRDYEIPAVAGRRSLVVAISYSGDTEETLSAFSQARRRGCPAVIIAGGGRLAREAGNVPVVGVPTGLPPRAALGFLFGSLLAVARTAGVWSGSRAEVAAAASFLHGRVGQWRRRARALAARLGGGLPFVYASSRMTEPAAERWRCQLNENAKVLCHSSVLPEHNHNEIVGLGSPAAARAAYILALTDRQTHPRTIKRLDHLLDIARGAFRGATVVPSEGETRLERLMSLVMMGDLFSVELAAARGVDPMPVARIDELKRRMAPAREARC
ncbi:MAG: bifunctional phosphoglucose/phosphomannose isomerase [bacterium]